MQAYLGEIDRHRIALINIDRPLTDAEILGRVQSTLTGRHSQIDKCFHDMRIESSKTGIETTFTVAKTQLIDTYRYDVPDSAKTEKKKPTHIDANLLKNADDGNNNNSPRRRPQRRRHTFKKGSCKHHPDATDHTTSHCYLEIRAKKGLPAGEKWCDVHARGTHYDSECRRHPGNSKRKRNPSKQVDAAMVAAAVKEQISLLFSHADKANHTVPNPPREASPNPSGREQTGPPTDTRMPTAENVFALISKLDDHGKHKLKTLLKS